MKYSESPRRPDAENGHPNRLPAANREGMLNLDPAKLLVIAVVAVMPGENCTFPTAGQAKAAATATGEVE